MQGKPAALRFGSMTVSCADGTALRCEGLTHRSGFAAFAANPRSWVRMVRRVAWILGLAVLSAAAQETNQVEQLRQQLRDANQQFERALREHRAAIDELNRRLQALEALPPGARTNLSPAVTATADTNAPPVTHTSAITSVPPVTNAPPAVENPAAIASAPPAWQPSDPLRIGNASTYVDLGLVGTAAVGGSTARDIEGGTQAGGHDPYQRGFNLQGIELNLQGAVDPYFRANANVVYSLNAAGESIFELEEGWMETMTLPANLKVRAGQVLTEFGRHNPIHLHAWSFVDAPVINGRFLGPDGLRNPGALLSWLTPTPFYSELMLGIQNSHGETASGFRNTDAGPSGLPLAYRLAENDRGVSGMADLLFSPRYAVSVDLTPSQVVLVGGSAAIGPNASGASGSGDTMTRIYGADLTWKWKSPRHHGGFPFVQWQSEFMLREYEAGAFDWAGAPGVPVWDTATGGPAFLPGETLTDYGFYSQVVYGFRKGWAAGLRVDYVTGERAEYETRPLTLGAGGPSLGPDPQRAERWRLSPNLTWFPSEYSKLRLQYNYDDRRGIGQDHSVWFQFEFALGAHAAHRF